MIMRLNAHELKQTILFKCSNKAYDANGRFADHISPCDVYCLLVRFKYRCLYCGENLKPKTWQLDHFYSRAMGGKNVIENLAPACKWCNQMKNALDGHAFIEKCKKVAQFNFLDPL